MKPKVIRTEADYAAALARVAAIFDAKPGTLKGDELEVWLVLVEKYEEAVYPIDLPDPIAALRFRMEQAQLRPKDLEPYIGSESKVSEVLNGQRPLSLTMIRKFVAGLHLPAEVALRETKAPSARRAKDHPSRRKRGAAAAETPPASGGRRRIPPPSATRSPASTTGS
jgi:HTH-type transcriptional regulator / antitoxin HigA